MNLEFFGDTLRGIGLLVVICGGFYLILLGLEKSVFVQILGCLLAGIMCGSVVWDTHYEIQMLKSTQTIPATITDMRITRGRRSSRGYRIDLVYTSPFDGTQQTDDAKLSKKDYEQAAIGDTVNLMVSVEDPSVTLLEHHYPPSRPLLDVFAFLLSVFFIGIGILGIWVKVDDWLI